MRDRVGLKRISGQKSAWRCSRPMAVVMKGVRSKGERPIGLLGAGCAAALCTCELRLVAWDDMAIKRSDHLIDQIGQV